MSEQETKNVLKETRNEGAIVGELSEKHLEFYDANFKTLEQKDLTGYEDKVAGIRGSVVIMVNSDNDTEEFYETHIFSNRLTKAEKDNPMYKGFITIKDKYKAKSEGGEGEFVKVEIKVGLNDFYNKEGVLVSQPKLNIVKMNRVSKDQESSAKVILEGAISNWKEETRKDGEEVVNTGRLLVDFGVVGFGGKLLPISLVIPEDLAEGFTSTYAKGNTVELNGNIEHRWVGAKKKERKKATFGRVEEESADTSSGYSVEEIVVFNGSDPYTADYGLEEEAISIEDLKTARNERENVTLPALKKKWEDKNEKKSGGSSQGLGGKPMTDVKDEEIPF